MANWPVTGAVVVAEESSYPTRRVLHLRCDQGDFGSEDQSEPGSVDTEQRLAVLDHVACRGFRHAPALLRTFARTRASCTPSRTITLLEYIPAPVITGDADALAGWRDLGAAAARLNGLADYTVPFALPVHRVTAALAARAAGTPFDAGIRSLLGSSRHAGRRGGDGTNPRRDQRGERRAASQLRSCTARLGPGGRPAARFGVRLPADRSIRL